MVGNDVVDLQLANQESRWQDPRFANKIFNESEKELINFSANKFETIWWLWSIKESAYKVYLQQDNSSFFDPKKIEVKILNNIEATAFIGDIKYKTKTIKTPTFIYTTAESWANKKIVSQQFSITSSNNSIYCNNQLVLFFAKHYGLNSNLLKIYKDKRGIPKIYYGNDESSKSISITHHGKFAAICFN